MYLIYAGALGVFDCSAELAEWISGHRSLQSEPTLCVWLIPGTHADDTRLNDYQPEDVYL